jgi:Shikimate dehydrogenase substrate binding domain
MQPALTITGSTRLYALVGDPLKSAKSPELLNRIFTERHIDAACVPFVVEANDLSAFVAGARAVRNLSGVLVTMPHKKQVLDFVDELHPTARQVGAVNVIRCDDDGRWVGAIFDGLGCVLGMQWEGYRPANKTVLLVGAGGAGRAIAFAVASAGARTLNIFDVDERRAQDLAASVAAATGPSRSTGLRHRHQRHGARHERRRCPAGRSAAARSGQSRRRHRQFARADTPVPCRTRPRLPHAGRPLDARGAGGSCLALPRFRLSPRWEDGSRGGCRRSGQGQRHPTNGWRTT